MPGDFTLWFIFIINCIDRISIYCSIMSFKHWPAEPKEKKYRPPKREELLRLRTCNLLISINHGARAYYNVGTYSKRKASTSFSWHLITVHHEGRFRKAQILRVLSDVVGECEFYPVAYREGPAKDQFLIKNARLALQKLFGHKLRIPMGKEKPLPLTVQLDVGNFASGHINPAERIYAAVHRQFQRLESTEHIPAIMNLDDFAKLPGLEDICVILRNKPVFDAVCKVIAQNQQMITSIRGIRLTNNGIATLSSLQYLDGSSLLLLDIRHNSIDNIEELNHLKNLSLVTLYLSGNKCTESSHYLYRAKEILPTLQILDGIPTKQIIPGTSSADRVELEFPGDVITPSDITEDFNISKYKRSEMWHQVIIIHAGRYTKDVLVRSIYASLKRWNTPMFMCYYQVGPEMDSFLVRNSQEHLEIFVENKLILEIVDEKDSVQMAFKMNVNSFQPDHVDPVEAMLACIPERFSSTDKILNLESFAKSTEQKNVTLSLSSPAIVMTILIQCARRYSTAVGLHLNDNDIISSKGMQALPYFKSLKLLNLSKNRIATIDDLCDIPKNSYEEIYLDGNPLCQDYCKVEEYIKDVRGVFPDIIQLDGVDLNTTFNFGIQRNFLANMEGYSFVENFVQFFIETYDSQCRPQLSEMYGTNALLSISFLWKDESFDEERMDTYNSISRNCLYSYSDDYVYFGQEEIKKIFGILPETEHDPFTFQIDCPTFSDKLVVIQISGVFREKLESNLDYDLILGFRRTFVLVPHNPNMKTFGYACEYKIVNEQYHIQHPSELQLKKAFKHTKSESSKKDEPTPEDKEVLTAIFQKLTCLKTLWCSKLFADAKWNFAKALEIYCDFRAGQKLPLNAFLDKPVD